MSRDRDVYVDKHTPPRGVPEFVCEDITKTYSHDPEKLKQHRRRRSTSERLEILEEKHDRLIHKVVDSRTRIIIAIVGAVSAALGYLMGGCAL